MFGSAFDICEKLCDSRSAAPWFKMSHTALVACRISGNCATATVVGRSGARRSVAVTDGDHNTAQGKNKRCDIY